MGGCISTGHSKRRRQSIVRYSRNYTHQKKKVYFGYAESQNKYKSHVNEDQAFYEKFEILVGGEAKICEIWGVCDGHQYYDSALYTVRKFPIVLQENLDEINDIDEVEMILYDSFINFDPILEAMPGGCTVLIFCMIEDTYWFAHAGDSRGIIIQDSEVIHSTPDHTPVSDVDRLIKLCNEKPELLGIDWKSPDNVTDQSKIPVVVGRGKKAKILNVIGCARGFGDFNLFTPFDKLPVKPFLTCEPDIWRQKHGFQHNGKGKNTKPLRKKADETYAVMGSDGIWDRVQEENVVMILEKEKDVNVAAESIRKLALANGSGDDITVFVIPLHTRIIE